VNLRIRRVVLVVGFLACASGAHAATLLLPLSSYERLEAIKDHGLSTPEQHRDRAEARLAVTSRKVNAHAARTGDEKMAETLGNEFGVAPTVLLDEKRDLGVTWAEVMIAHVLGANSHFASPREIVEIERQGLGWGQIAAGMGFGLRETVRAAQRECRVAIGTSKAGSGIAVLRSAIEPQSLVSDGPGM